MYEARQFDSDIMLTICPPDQKCCYGAGPYNPDKHICQSYELVKKSKSEGGFNTIGFNEVSR